MSFAAAQKAANRVIEKMDAQFDLLTGKADKLDKRLTEIS